MGGRARTKVQGGYSPLSHLPAQIQVGNFNQTIATLQLGGSETAIIVSIVICSILLLLSVVGKDPTSVTAERTDLAHLTPPSAAQWTAEKAEQAGVPCTQAWRWERVRPSEVGEECAQRRHRGWGHSWCHMCWPQAESLCARPKGLGLGFPVHRELMEVLRRGWFREGSLSS